MSFSADLRDELAIAYLAGVVDADGYVTATRSVRNGVPYYGAQVGITGSNRAPHDLAAGIFGGRVSAHSPGRERSHHLTQFHWQRGGRRALPVIDALMPHLRIKAHRARLVVELQEFCDERREAIRDGEDPFPWFGPDYDPTTTLDALVADIRSAQTRGRTWDEYPQAVTR